MVTYVITLNIEIEMRHQKKEFSLKLLKKRGLRK
jgi:hypothetical protein